MLVGIIAVYVIHIQAGGTPTFDATELAKTPIPPALQLWPFLAFALAFAIKVPIWPLHTWLPDLYAEMPLGAVYPLSQREDVLYLEPQDAGEKPPQNGNPNDDVIAGRGLMVTDNGIVVIAKGDGLEHMAPGPRSS